MGIASVELPKLPLIVWVFAFVIVKAFTGICAMVAVSHRELDTALTRTYR